MSVKSQRESFYSELRELHMSPLWEHLHALVPKAPTTPIVPAMWKWDRVRQHLMRAGELVSAAEAERRVLILENPGLPGRASATHSLYAGVQLVLPGEVARAHRHIQSALRFVLEGTGAFTAVNGERVTLHPGDLVLTPSMRWHDHGNPTQEPTIWVDGLDIPLISYFDAGFAETARELIQPRLLAEGHSALAFGNNLLPVDWRPPDLSSPILSYPYSRSRETLLGLARSTDPDSCHGYKLRFVSPASGGAPMPTIGAFIQSLPMGFVTSEYRSTDGAIFVCVDGEGTTSIGSEAFTWSKNDVFVVPSWQTVIHRAALGSVLFSFSDRPVQQALGIWREDRYGVAIK